MQAKTQIDSANSKLPRALQDHTGYLITDIGRLYRTAMDRKMLRFRLTRSQWWLVSFLYYFEGATQQQLADVMDTGRGGIGKLIDRLERKGLVRRAADESDARLKRVYLSESVKPLAADIEHELSQTAEGSLHGMSSAEVDQLNTLLKKVRHNLVTPKQVGGRGLPD